MAQNPGQDVDLEIEMDQVAAEPQENRRENPGMQVAGDDQEFFFSFSPFLFLLQDSDSFFSL